MQYFKDYFIYSACLNCNKTTKLVKMAPKSVKIVEFFSSNMSIGLKMDDFLKLKCNRDH